MMKFKYSGTARLKEYDSDLYQGVSIGVKITSRNTDTAYEDICRGLDIPAGNDYWEITWNLIEGVEGD